jgi:hypothetical protein
MPTIEPASVISDGMVLILAVPTIMDPDFPTVNELTAPSVTDLSCYLTDNGWDPQVTEETSTDPRLCSRQTFTRPGRNQTTLPLIYVYNIELPEEDEARLALPDRTILWIAARWGVDFETPVAAGDVFDLYPVQVGVQTKQKATANTPLTIMQTAYVRAPGTQYDKIVVAS